MLAALVDADHQMVDPRLLDWQRGVTEQADAIDGAVLAGKPALGGQPAGQHVGDVLGHRRRQAHAPASLLRSRNQ